MKTNKIKEDWKVNILKEQLEILREINVKGEVTRGEKYDIERSIKLIEYGLDTGYQQATADLIKMIDNFSKVENLNISFSDIPLECPICKLSARCFSRPNRESYQEEICIYCRIRNLKQMLVEKK
jgi:hypothetical protein